MGLHGTVELASAGDFQVPEPMLSARGTKWPTGSDWVLQVKWDGFRLLLEIPRRGVVRAWSRHGASLSQRLPGILEPFREMPPGTIVDGELVALAERDDRPTQDFAAVRRAVFNGDTAAGARLRFVAFDLLSSLVRICRRGRGSSATRN